VSEESADDERTAKERKRVMMRTEVFSLSTSKTRVNWSGGP